SKAPIDITRTVLPSLPDPCERLAHLARGEEGYLTGLAYESLRKASTSHPYVAQLMRGSVEIFVELEDLNLTVSIGEVELTACTTVAPNFSSSPHLEAGFGIAFGANERKAVAMAIVDQHFKIEGATSDALMHTDGVAASGYVSHLKLPHYSDFDADLARLRRVQAKEEI
ncbi:carbon-phosphorus lyase complex subunit PhnI, partial [Micrococcus luteus]|nr:carbon-phosphorus lyase complex subunit PhnI [Micrococcus luteus]